MRRNQFNSRNKSGSKIKDRNADFSAFFLGVCASPFGSEPQGRRPRSFPPCLLLLMTFLAAWSFAGPSTVPAVDPKLLAQLQEIDARAAHIQSLSADFEQRKFTALLRKPLISSGNVRVKGATMRWDTLKPEKTTLLVTDKQVEIEYPAQSTVEIYPLDRRFADLAASPLPRLSVLKQKFAFVRIDPATLDKSADPAKTLALELTPVDDELRQHVQRVRVLLDIAAGYIVQFEMTDADGDRTLIHFLNPKLNAEVGELDLKIPAGMKIVRPLEGLPAPSPDRGR